MNYPLRSNYPREGFQDARDGTERVLGLCPPHSVGADRSHGRFSRFRRWLSCGSDSLVVVLPVWHGKHQTAGVVCLGTGKLGVGS